MVKKRNNINGSIPFHEYVGWLITELILGISACDFTKAPINVSFESDKYPYDYFGVTLAIKTLKKMGLYTSYPKYRMWQPNEGGKYKKLTYTYSFEFKLYDTPF